MKNGKYSRKGSKRIVTLLLALVLILGCGIGGTLAYLTANTDEVTNTFVMGDIGTLDLTESDSDDTDTDADNNTYVVVPGVDITKDPKVTYKYTQTNTTDYEQQDVYIFVTVDAAEDGGDGWTYASATTGEGESAVTTHAYSVGTDAEGKALLSWTVDPAWTYLKTEADGRQVYYMAQTNVDETGITKSIIAGDTITVSDKIEMKHLDSEDDAYIMNEVDNIVFKAYAIQQAGFSDTKEGETVTATAVENAWDAVKTVPATTP